MSDKQLNKQQLAALIWKSADEMRGNIDAVKYKDYIFGLMFYKFLSEKETDFFESQGFGKDDLDDLTEDNEDARELAQNNIGYYISGNHLFNKWYEDGNDFAIDELTRALSAFERNIVNKKGKENITKLYSGIFDAFSKNLDLLGGTDAEKSKKIRKIVEIIEKIPMHNKDYDVLGFVYEFLLKNFASNAGKKAGEFYSPLSIAEINAQIISERLKGKEQISLLDMCVGSGSLMLKVGEATAKHMKNKNGVKYYGQELITETYNLCRMNLIMKGILPDNILIRNGNTLKDDWPYFENNADDGTYVLMPVDAVSSNPPYSAKYEPSDDPRFEYGIAPNSKADYAFLQHGLYHLKDDGIMCIVLPHGVLFRGGSEAEIRKNLIERNRIEAIIGLPAGIFNNTGIPTIIMVLSKSNMFNGDILIVDASKGFVKDGKINVLRDKDIKKIVDTVNGRLEEDKYSRIVTKEEIKANDYNLNIPRYVDSSEPEEKQNIYSLMFGGIPEDEINDLNDYWKVLPNLKKDLFVNLPYASLSTPNYKEFIKNHSDVAMLKKKFHDAFNGFDIYLKDKLINHLNEVNIYSFADEVSDNIFERFNNIDLIDKYDAYQAFADVKPDITIDLETIKNDGFDSIRQVEEVYTTKKSKGKEVEVLTGYKGRILPFELVQKELLTEDYNNLKNKQMKLQEVGSSLDELIESIPEEDKNEILNDANDAFVTKEVQNSLNSIYEHLTIENSKVYDEYLRLTKKNEKLDFIQSHNEIEWQEMEASKDGTYNKKAVTSYIMQLKSKTKFEEGSIESILVQASELLDDEKKLKSEIKSDEKDLELKTKQKIETLSYEECKEMLNKKWIVPLIDKINNLCSMKIDELIIQIDKLANKYSKTLSDIDSEIDKTEKELVFMIDELEGNKFDIKGLQKFKSLMVGDPNEK